MMGTVPRARYVPSTLTVDFRILRHLPLDVSEVADRMLPYIK